MAKKDKKQQKSYLLLKTLACILAFIISAVGSFAFGFISSFLDKDESNVTLGSLSIHVMELGNEYAGDSIYIKAGDTDILIDAGSRASSVSTITNYVNQFCTDGILEYVIVTHADQDHIAGFAGTNAANTSVFDFYKCGTIIDFALSNKTTAVYNRYIEKRDNEVANDGAVHYTALQCWNNADGAQRVYDLGSDMSLEILYQKFYENTTGDENNYSVCLMLKHGDKNFLLTGDLEKEGEESLLESNDLPEVEFFKAGHHGSKTSSSAALIEKVKPEIVAISCVAGSVEYTQNLQNTFPTKQVIDRFETYNIEQVYVTSYATIEKVGDEYENTGFGSLNGTIVVISKGSGVTVECTNNNTVLKDSDWFKSFSPMWDLQE